jgi:hypothetical protein
MIIAEPASRRRIADHDMVHQAQPLIPAGVKADSLTGFQTGKHLTMSIGLRDWVNA